MPTPEYVLALRRSYGQGLLLLPGVSAVVLSDASTTPRILLGRRSDNGLWELPSGIVEPGEQPADAIVREVLEETRVHIRADRLVLLTADPEMSYPNGDRCQFLSMTFRCSYLEGDAAVGDEESSEVRWFDLSAVPQMSPRHRRRIDCALAPAGPTQFDSDSS